MNLEFVRAVRLKKLLAGQFEPSGVREKGLGLVLSVSASGIVKERGDPVSMVDDVASWSSIDECTVKHRFTRGCLFQDIVAILEFLEVVVHLFCYRLCVNGGNMVHWYAGLQGLLFHVLLCHRYVVSQACRSVYA